LYVGAELVYVPDDAQRSVTRIDPTWPMVRQRSPHRRSTSGFLPPRRLPNDRLAVTHTDGGFYVFDLSKLTD
jgi:hypothetical protein